MVNEDVKILDKKYKSPILFLGKQRELAKTTKRVTNQIRFLLKKEYENNNLPAEEYITAGDEWIKEAQKLVKSIISPISNDELEYIDVLDLKGILDSIERRKYKARGYTDDEIDLMEEAERANIVAQTKLVIQGAEEVDFQMNNSQNPQSQNTALDMNTGKPNTSEE